MLADEEQLCSVCFAGRSKQKKIQKARAPEGKNGVTCYSFRRRGFTGWGPVILNILAQMHLGYIGFTCHAELVVLIIYRKFHLEILHQVHMQIIE